MVREKRGLDPSHSGSKQKAVVGGVVAEDNKKAVPVR
jgi:hypothetical protein